VKTDLENTLFSATLKPLLKLIISHFDFDCSLIGSLILNSLRYFLDEPVSLRPTCQHLSANIIGPLLTVITGRFQADADHKLEIRV